MIPVCYSCNRQIFHGVVLSALSVVNNTAEPVSVYILTADLSYIKDRYVPVTQRQADDLETILKRINPECEVHLVDAGKYYSMYLEHGKNENNRYTPYTYLRLLLDCFENLPEKIIYMDVDTLATGDIKELYDTDIDGKELAAAYDKVGHWLIRKNYFNAGVLLLNLNRIRETGMLDKCRRMIFSRRYIMTDQTVMNKCTKERVLLPFRFNEQRKLQSDTLIKHFCRSFMFYGPVLIIRNYKPWDRDEVRKKLKTSVFDGLYDQFDKLDEEFHITESCAER